MRDLYIWSLLVFFSVCQSSYAAEKKNKLSPVIPTTLPTLAITPLQFGGVGDGVKDDTEAVQAALTICSQQGKKCYIPAGKSFVIKQPIFLWGKASLLGVDESSKLLFDGVKGKHLVNIGISAPLKLEAAFSGAISKVTFEIVSGDGGRVIFFWRTDGAHIKGNIFDVGEFEYGPTSSGNNNNWVRNGFANCIRKNITIEGNWVFASGRNRGSEGIGLGHFDGVVIRNNKIIGVGDDPIGLHFCKNVKVIGNELSSVDGRLYVVNSVNVEIAHNLHKRVASKEDGKFYPGISLLYVGFETLRANNYAAPTNYKVHHNQLIYEDGAVDTGAAIYLYAPRDSVVEYNTITNHSATVKAKAIYLLPARFSGDWKDPSGVESSRVARVGNVRIEGNVSDGEATLSMGMSGNCDEYSGAVTVKGNTSSEFNFYCKGVVLSENVVSQVK